VEPIRGGPELIVLPIAGARSVSLRLVFRAGSAMDPMGKEGLAHLVEHMLVEGAPGRLPLLDEARGAGVELNAFTSRDATYFAVDGPSAASWPLATRLLRSVTNPAFPKRELDVQLEIVRREADFRGASAERGTFLEGILFPVPEAGPLGGERSRDRISRADLVAWHQRNYLTSNATVILAGAVTPEQARELVARDFLLPPALPDEEVAPRPARISLPVSQKVRARVIAFLHGYAFEATERAACEGLANLVQLRMVLGLTVREPLLADATAECLSVRGNWLLVASGYSRSLDASDVPEKMAGIFRDLAASPASAREREVLVQRLQRSWDLARADPAALADEATSLAATPRNAGPTPLPFTLPPLTAPRDLRDEARRRFVPDREIRLVLSPLEG
jgi:hypothetical protein